MPKQKPEVLFLPSVHPAQSTSVKPDNGLHSLLFHNGEEVFFEYNERHDTIVMYSTLDYQFNIKDYSLELLKANAFGKGTQGSHFSFDEHDKILLLEKHYCAPLPSKDRLSQEISDFLETMTLWKTRLLEMPKKNTTNLNTNNLLKA